MNKLIKQINRIKFLKYLLSLTVLLATSCAAFSPRSTATPQPTFTVEAASTPTTTPTKRPTATPTPSPLGSAENPIKIGYVIQAENTPAIDASDAIEILVSGDTGLAVENIIFSDFRNLANAVANDEVHLFWADPFEYLYLSQIGKATAMVMTNHLGVYAYGVQFIAHNERGFTTYFDPELNQNRGDFLTAIQQFSGTRPCFISPDSMPGYLVPLGLLANASTPTLEPVFTYSYNAVIRALYIQGICDFGVSYALIGDPLNTSDIIVNLPDASAQIVTLWQSDGIIPNKGLAASTELPLNIRFQLQEAFLDLPGNPEGLSFLSTALTYDVEGLKSIRDEFYQPLRSVIAPLLLDLETITQQNPSP